MKKLLLATPLYPPDTGGPATDTKVLEKTLPKYGISTEVYSFGEVRHLPRGVRHLRYFFGLIARSRKADGIVALDTFSVCVPVMCTARILRKPFIVRVPGDYAWEQAVQRFGVHDTIESFQKKRYGLRVEFMRIVQAYTVKRASLVVVPSDFLKNIVQTWGISQEKLVRIYLGIDLNEKYFEPKEVPDGRIIFSLGRLVPWKGFPMIIELIKELPQEWKLVIAGDGPLSGELNTLAKTIGVSNRVLFLGAIPHREALGWYRLADVFVQNTSQETFSFQILEALASGVPIVTTNVGPIPELITNGVEGVLCSPDDKEAFLKAVKSVADEPGIWDMRRIDAQKRAKNFSNEKSVDIFVSTIIKHI